MKDASEEGRQTGGKAGGGAGDEEVRCQKLSFCKFIFDSFTNQWSLLPEIVKGASQGNQANAKVSFCCVCRYLLYVCFFNSLEMKGSSQGNQICGKEVQC